MIHSFVIICKEHDLTNDQAEKLFQAGCDDALPGVLFRTIKEGDPTSHQLPEEESSAYVDFDREAPSLGEAISSAITQVQSIGLTPSRIDIDIK